MKWQSAPDMKTGPQARTLGEKAFEKDVFQEHGVGS